jgi:hypothetical protein
VVGDGNRFHVESASLVQQLTDPDRAVEEAEFCVNVKVNKGGRTAQENLVSCQKLESSFFKRPGEILPNPRGKSRGFEEGLTVLFSWCKVHPMRLDLTLNNPISLNIKRG